LKGKVEYFSDKKIPSVFIDKDWETLIDTTQSSLISIQNKYFNKNGYLTNLKYYDKDSILLINSEILFSNTGKYEGSKDLDKDGNQLKWTKIIKSTPEFLKVESYDFKTGDLISKSKTEYKNGLYFRQISEYVNQNRKSDFIIKRDEEGNEIEISFVVEYGEQIIENVTNIKYLEFDSLGNWTKRIEYNREKGKECMLIIRRIQYYE
jgi:hypothetical protein